MNQDTGEFRGLEPGEKPKANEIQVRGMPKASCARCRGTGDLGLNHRTRKHMPCFCVTRRRARA